MDIGNNKFGITCAASVTASNTDNIVPPLDSISKSAGTRGLYVGTSGTLSVVFASQPTTSVSITGLATGMWHPMNVIRVNSTGTTATNILAGW